MKMVLLLSTILVFLLFPASAHSADTVSGLVSDSITNRPLGGVTVMLVARSCSTVTSPAGTFTLSIPIPTSTFQPSVVRKTIRQSDDVAWLDLKGCVIGKEGGHPSGVWLARVKLPEGEAVSRILSLGSARRSGNFAFSGQSSEVVGQVLAKSAAVSYPLSFKKDGYSPLSKTASAGQSVVVKLVPEGVIGDVQITTDSTGTLTVITEIK